MEERGSYYYINNEGIQIHNAYGLAEFQEKYNIFYGNEIIDLVEFISKSKLGSLSGNDYYSLIQEINGRFQSVISNLDIKNSILWDKVPKEWNNLELSIWQGNWVLKSILIKL